MQHYEKLSFQVTYLNYNSSSLSTVSFWHTKVHTIGKGFYYVNYSQGIRGEDF